MVRCLLAFSSSSFAEPHSLLFWRAPEVVLPCQCRNIFRVTRSPSIRLPTPSNCPNLLGVSATCAEAVSVHDLAQSGGILIVGHILHRSCSCAVLLPFQPLPPEFAPDSVRESTLLASRTCYGLPTACNSLRSVCHLRISNNSIVLSQQRTGFARSASVCSAVLARISLRNAGRMSHPDDKSTPCKYGSRSADVHETLLTGSALTSRLAALAHVRSLTVKQSCHAFAFGKPRNPVGTSILASLRRVMSDVRFTIGAKR